MSRKATTTRTLNPLPFQDLEPHRFEDLVRNLIHEYRPWASIEATGRSGSDDGFDIRAWERVEGNEFEEPEDDDHVTSAPKEGRLWKIQCKRERQLGPARIQKIINEGVSPADPPYGYILVAPSNFSKASYDLFRSELRTKGVQEFALWGRAELEDMLLLPKNDGVLFAFFGISLVSRRRKRSSDIKFALNNKNKLIRVLASGNLSQRIHAPVVLRDIKDTHYPFESEYNDFEKMPRWKEYTVTRLDPRGVIAEVKRHLAYVDRINNEFDIIRDVDFLQRRSDDFNEEKAKIQEEARKKWNSLRRGNQAQLLVKGLIAFEDMLVIDDKGDPYFQFPHIFVDFSPEKGPFRAFFTR